MSNIPKRFSVALAFPRDGGEALLLGASEKQSELLPLLDQIDPAEIAVAGIAKDIQFTVKRTYAEPGVNQNPVPVQIPAQESEEEIRLRHQTLEGYTDEELRELVAPEYKVDPEGKTREDLIAAIKVAAGYKQPEPPAQ